MNKQYLQAFLEDEKENWPDLDWNIIETIDYDWIFTIVAPNSSTLEYLNNNEADVIYYDFWGLIIVKC